MELPVNSRRKRGTPLFVSLNEDSPTISLALDVNGYTTSSGSAVVPKPTMVVIIPTESVIAD